MRTVIAVVAFVGLALTLPVLADKSAPADKAGKIAETLDNFRAAEVTKPYFTSAYGYAVFPTIGKGGVGIGGAGGKGYVFEQGRYMGESTMVQVSVGFQFGGQAFSQIVFFKDKNAFDEFTREGFEFGADISAVAVTAGAQAQAGTAGVSASASVTPEHGKAVADYYKGMAVVTLAKGGLMYQAALAGQKYTFKRNAA